MNATFRRAIPHDLNRLIEFMQSLYNHDQSPFDETVARKAALELIDNPGKGEIWIIEDEGKDAGYMVLCMGFSLEFGGTDAFLDEIYIEKESRGKGIGSAAILFLEKECASRGVHALHLTVERSNKRAKKFYLDRGFERRNWDLMTKRIK